MVGKGFSLGTIPKGNMGNLSVVLGQALACKSLHGDIL